MSVMSKPIILVAEDNESDTFLIKTLLEPFYQVDTVITGAEAVEILKNKKYDLLITDIRMPVMGGIELLVVCDAHYPDMPAIVVSAACWQYAGYKDRHPNAKFWIEKPFKPSVLIGIIAGTIADFS